MWVMLEWLLKNAILLFALVFIYGIMDIRITEKRRLVREIVTGLLIGSAAVFVMMNPWELSTGLIFDARSVLLSITAAFFGPIPSFIAGLAAIIYRALLGGPGVYAGILTVFVSIGVGLLWQRFRGTRKNIRYFPEFVLFGLVTHIFVVTVQLAIPWPTAFTVIKAIALPFLVFYPIVTGILALALHNQKERLEQGEIILNDRILLRAVIESPKGMTAMAVDTKYRFLIFNSEYHDQVEKDYGTAPRIGENVLDFFHDNPTAMMLKEDIDRALAGAQFTNQRSLHGGALWLEALWNPIKDEHGTVIGATQFCQNVTERIRKDEQIIHIARHDTLTGLFNRRAYAEELARPVVDYRYPVSVVMADINGLKITNDAFGHAAGDQLLLKIAEMFSARFRPEDRIYRIGGDEFVILMQNTTRAQAEDIVDEIKAEMEQTVLFGLNVSVSFGIDTNHDGTDLANSVKLAEIEMYDHKLFEISSNRGEAIK
ncbi:MAG: diguanylate cyclase, partial [Bacillota bacterium]|nr:diguanylate cyclase [Bacillota bacterium]